MASALGIPLDAHQLTRVMALERLVRDRYRGWGREGDEGAFFVDVDTVRYRGETLHQALGQALRANGGQ